MGLSNAERQRRHRDRVKARLAGVLPQPAAPLRNDFLETMQFAFLVGYRQAVKEFLVQVDEKPLLPYDSDWHVVRDALAKEGYNLDQLTEEFFVGLISASGHRMGNYLAASMYRDFLAEEVKRQEPPPPVPTKRGRRAVT